MQYCLDNCHGLPAFSLIYSALPFSRPTEVVFKKCRKYDLQISESVPHVELTVCRAL